MGARHAFKRYRNTYGRRAPFLADAEGATGPLTSHRRPHNAQWRNGVPGTFWIVNAVERAAVFPSSGRVTPESDRTDIREVILDHFRIVYLLGNARITVLTVFESHRPDVRL